MNQFKWYAVYTYPRHEKKVFEQLVLREIESFLPLLSRASQVAQWLQG